MTSDKEYQDNLIDSVMALLGNQPHAQSVIQHHLEEIYKLGKRHGVTPEERRLLAVAECSAQIARNENATPAALHWHKEKLWDLARETYPQEPK